MPSFPSSPFSLSPECGEKRGTGKREAVPIVLFSFSPPPLPTQQLTVGGRRGGREGEKPHLCMHHQQRPKNRGGLLGLPSGFPFRFHISPPSPPAPFTLVLEYFCSVLFFYCPRSFRSKKGKGQYSPYSTCSGPPSHCLPFCFSLFRPPPLPPSSNWGW